MYHEYKIKFEITLLEFVKSSLFIKSILVFHFIPIFAYFYSMHVHFTQGKGVEQKVCVLQRACLFLYCVASVVCITLVCIRPAHFPRGMLGSVQHDSYSMFYRLSMNLIFYSNKEGPLFDPLLFNPLFSMPIVESALFNGISPQYSMFPTLSLSNVVSVPSLQNTPTVRITFLFISETVI